jgi:hypothetical protein
MTSISHVVVVISCYALWCKKPKRIFEPKAKTPSLLFMHNKGVTQPKNGTTLLAIEMKVVKIDEIIWGHRPTSHAIISFEKHLTLSLCMQIWIIELWEICCWRYKQCVIFKINGSEHWTHFTFTIVPIAQVILPYFWRTSRSLLALPSIWRDSESYHHY